MMKAAVGVMLSVCALEDWCTKKITVWYPVICMVMGIILRIKESSLKTVDFWLGLLLGGIMMALGAVSREQLGMGDGLILTACGVCLGWKNLMFLLLCSMVMFLVVGVVGIAAGRWTGKKALCFVPFIWCAFMVICLMGGF